MAELPHDERRATRRLSLDLPLEVQLPEGSASQPRLVFAQLVDVGVDGRGAAVRVPVRSRVPVGGPVSLLLEHDAPIRGIVVSRLGTSRYDRLGIRIDPDCREHMLLLARTAAADDSPTSVANC